MLNSLSDAQEIPIVIEHLKWVREKSPLILCTGLLDSISSSATCPETDNVIVSSKDTKCVWFPLLWRISVIDDYFMRRCIQVIYFYQGFEIKYFDWIKSLKIIFFNDVAVIKLLKIRFQILSKN